MLAEGVNVILSGHTPQEGVSLCCTNSFTGNIPDIQYRCPESHVSVRSKNNSKFWPQSRSISPLGASSVRQRLSRSSSAAAGSVSDSANVRNSSQSNILFQLSSPGG
eukprot:6236977-Amphidinium_carterae.1